MSLASELQHHLRVEPNPACKLQNCFEVSGFDLASCRVCISSQITVWVQVRELEDLMANDDAWANVPEREQEEKENVLRQESE